LALQQVLLPEQAFPRVLEVPQLDEGLQQPVLEPLRLEVVLQLVLVHLQDELPV
jgi:hypothetical protein